MPICHDIHTVLIIGSGPIIIGQACKALRELGYRIVLVNSNLATIMTDPGMADVTYIEPLNVATLEKIIARERPDALLPNLGGQSALNLSTDLARLGILEKYGVQVIGVNLEAIERGEDRIEFKKAMDRLGIEMPESTAVYSVVDAESVAADLGYPVVIRPAYTMGGTGGGMVYNQEDLHRRTSIHRWFLEQMRELVVREEEILAHRGTELPLALLRLAKQEGFADAYLAKILGREEGDIRTQRTRAGIVEGWHAVPVSGVENAAYYYSSYNAPDTVSVSANPNKVMVLGGGPNRIGQGIEFDFAASMPP